MQYSLMDYSSNTKYDDGKSSFLFTFDCKGIEIIIEREKREEHIQSNHFVTS